MLIEADKLTIRRGRREVVRDLSLSIRADEGTVFIGPNGSGKTTLLLALLGLLRPATGRIRIDGRDLRQFGARQRGLYGAYVPQTLDHVPAFSVYDLVAGGRFPHLAALRPLSAHDDELIRAAIERCGLTALTERPINELSGGERQKALLAAAIAQDARVIFLDEPTTALDPAYQAELLSLMREWRGGGRGVICVSHDLHLPAVVATRVIALRGGALVADGAPEEVLHPDRLRQVYGTEFELFRDRAGRPIATPVW